MSDAERAFAEAARIARSAKDTSTERTATQWTNFVEKEKIRQQQIKASI